MEGHYNYTIDDKEIEFFIGNYALERSLEDLDASISDLSDLLNKKFMSLIRLFMYYSAEYAALAKDEKFTITKFDVYQWIDKTGGINGEFYSEFSKRLFKALGANTDTDKPAKK
jgi:hypothetical protein